MASASLGYYLYLKLTSKNESGVDRPPVNFEAYLKVPTENPCLTSQVKEKPKYAPTDFESYLKVQDPVSVTNKFSSNETSDDDSLPPAHLKPVAVLYGTEFGLSREVAESMGSRLMKTDKYWPLVLSMDDYPSGMDLSKFQVLFVACSTQGEGIPPTDARPFCSWLHGPSAPSVSSLKFSVCALGDTSYTFFAQCGKEIDRRLEELGGTRMAPRVDVNKEDWPVINKWIDNALAALEEQDLKTVADLGVGLNSMTSLATEVEAAKYTKSRPYFADVVSVVNLCSDTGDHGDKSTVRIDIDLGDSGLEYLPGDSLGIWPANDTIYVDEIIEFMGWDPDQCISKPNWHYQDSSRSAGNSMTLKRLLLECFDLKSPKQELLEILAEHGNCSKEMRDVLTDEKKRSDYLEERHVVDLLSDFAPDDRGTWLEAEMLIRYLRQLSPRLYSISSSPLINPRRVTLTVAIVEYLSLDKKRIGVCSTFLGKRVAEGSKIPVYVYSNPDFRLPENSSVPIIMVGPGTGVAPFRAFLQHRNYTSTAKETNTANRNVLFFGCRRRDQDYLYGEELELLATSNQITLFTAFSREQEKKVYVQDRLEENGHLVWSLLEQGGYFYICGDGKNMAGAVEATLHSIVEKFQGQGKAAAQDYISNLTTSHRFQRDVWVS